MTIFIEWITYIWVNILWTTALKRSHMKLRLYFKIFSDASCAIILLKMKIKTILKVKIHSLAKKLCCKNNLQKKYIFHLIKLYSLLQILIIIKMYLCFLALWVTVSQTFLTEKCLPEKILTKFLTKFSKQNFIKWFGTICNTNFSSNEYFGYDHVRKLKMNITNEKYFLHTSKKYFK